MRKLFLLLTAGIAAMSVNAQVSRSVVYNGNAEIHAETISSKPPAYANAPFSILNGPVKHKGHNSAAKTTSSVFSAWYNYPLALNAHDYPYNSITPYIWNDTSALFGYPASSGSGISYEHDYLLSIGAVFNVYDSIWDDTYAFIYFGDSTTVLPSDRSYAIDSVMVYGVYKRDSFDHTTVDTLIYSIVSGQGNRDSSIPIFYFSDGGDPSAFPYYPYGVDTLLFADLVYDQVNNRAGKGTAATDADPLVVKVPLYYTDTSSSYSKAIPVSYTVPAGYLAGVSVTFKSGSTLAYNDTVIRGTAARNNKYGTFSPYVAYHDYYPDYVEYPEYTVSRYNTGVFKIASLTGFDDLYTPEWDLVAAGGPSPLQSPFIGIHIVDRLGLTTGIQAVPATCATVSISPNPATTAASVTFSLPHTATRVDVSLVDMTGRTVAVRSLTNTDGGAILFDVSNLPAGIYTCRVTADGLRTGGGRVTVAH